MEGNGDPLAVEQEETHEGASGRWSVLRSPDFEKWKFEQEFRLKALHLKVEQEARQLEIREKARAEEKAKELELRELEVREKESAKADKWN